MKTRKNYKVLGQLPTGVYIIRSTITGKFNCLNKNGELISKRRWFTRIGYLSITNDVICGFNDNIWVIDKDGGLSFVTWPRKRISDAVRYINQHLKEGENELTVCHWLTEYLHSSYRYAKQNIDGSWLYVQPGWPEYTVTGYFVYEDNDMRFAHKTNQMALTLDNHYTTDISLYKFKKFMRNRYKNNPSRINC